MIELGMSGIVNMIEYCVCVFLGWGMYVDRRLVLDRQHQNFARTWAGCSMLVCKKVSELFGGGQVNEIHTPPGMVSGGLFICYFDKANVGQNVSNATFGYIRWHRKMMKNGFGCINSPWWLKVLILA